ncbi:hexosaminidase D [Cherax quadricarinatus]|uniref:hexosaminidase D n=1 Tax=Cherax quadricarinatus TaxID=27406 RepID=UPI00387E4DA2
MEDNAEKVHSLIHLDLKGAPPRLGYFEQLFPILSSFGATGLLVEYEDMFPYHGKVAHIRAPHAYLPDDIIKLHTLATNNNLIVIPLVQTFGHFEFVLKHDENRAIREIERYPNALCPTHPDAFPLVSRIIAQVVELHPNDKFFHIGADEVWHIGKCPRCQNEMEVKKMSSSDLFLAWVFKVAWWMKKEYPNLTIIMWDDMMRNMPLDKLKSSRIGELVEPMVWQYQAKKFDLPADIFNRYSAVFDGIWVASAFKGATGSTQFLPPIQHHINNHLTWISVLSEYKHQFKIYRGIALTGWQRPQVIEQCMSFPGHKIFVGVQMWSNFLCKYQAISNSEGMLGWFSDYLRSRNFTNPVQVENIMNSITEVLENLTELKTHLIPWLMEVYFEDTVEEWIGSFIEPLLEKLRSVIEECKKQILIGGRVRDYKKIEY